MGDSLQGKTAIITGGGTGIGAATAGKLGRLGMRLMLVGRRAAVVDEEARKLECEGIESVSMGGDVREFGDVVAVVEQTIQRFGRIDVLIANAAIADSGPIDQADPADWQAVIDTNVLGVLFSVRAVLPQMYIQGAGHIVIVSSGSGRTTYVGEPAYVASKHATVAFGNCLREEVAPRGIRVSLIEPGLVETPLIHRDEAGLPQQLIDAGVVPLQSEDVARAIRFALEQPPNCTVSEIALQPTGQR